MYIFQFTYERSGLKGLFERLILGININTLKKSFKRHYKHEEGIDPIQTDVATASTLFVTLSGDT